MKPALMLKYFISTILLCCCFTLVAQKDSITVKTDSVKFKNKYGLRVGIDLFNPVARFVEKNRKGLEIVGDYRISKKYYIAAELGYLQNTTTTDYLNFTTDGQYIKVGIDYNVYENWLDMENLIYIGARYGFSNFSHTLNNGIINNNGTLPEQPIMAPKEFNGLTGHWLEAVIGIKAEIFNNLFLGFSFNGKRMISSKKPANFKNMFIPGFNRVYLNNTGFGFNYTVSYLIPLYKR